MNKKKTIILLVIGILVVTISSIGITYSYMKPKVEKENNQTEIGINNCAKITLKDNDSTINLENMYPMEEEMGLQTTPYEFTISSTCEEYTGFNLYLLTYSDNGIADDLIRYGITSKNDTLLETNLITTEEANDITETEKNEINQGVNKNYSKIYKIYSNNIPLKGESEYKLHIWIDENAKNDTMGKNIKLGVIVKGYEREETMAEYLIAYRDNTLIYHDEQPDYPEETNYELEAGDLSYRYSGGNDEVNNYICFGGNCSNDPTNDNYLNLYRIIGLFDDDKDGNYGLKIIKADYATEQELGTKGNYAGKYEKVGSVSATLDDYTGDQKNYSPKIASFKWHKETVDSALWTNSELNFINLNDYFLNEYIGNGNKINESPNKWQKMLKKYTWLIGGNNFINLQSSYDTKKSYIYEISENADKNAKVNAYVGLMYLNDYRYAADNKHWLRKGNNSSPNTDYRVTRTDNWLYLGLYEWTITRRTDIQTSSFRIDYVGCIGEGYRNLNHAVRPVMYLKTNVKKASNSGIGTSDNPYQISL